MPSYAPPFMSDTVKRQRLFTLLDAHRDRQNILITGQAAQGKTTLLATYLAGKNWQTLWINLTADDRDHSKLFNRILSAFQTQINPGTATLSNSILGTQKDLLRHVQTLVQMISGLSSDLVLVLDDMEQIGNQSTGARLIRHLVEARFEHARIFMLSRQMPELNFAWLKMARRLFMLANEDLSFTVDETKLFFMSRDRISQDDIEKIHRVTDGWAGGMVLILESFRQIKGGFELPERLTSEVFNYFSHEIYQQLEPPVQDFLMKTAVLDIIDPQMADHLFESAEIFSVLEELENRNLFIQRMESESPAYRYHHLFKAFLLQKLLSSRGKDYFRELNHRVGRYFWKKRDHESAFEYFNKAGSFREMVQIIKIKGTDLIIRGDFPSLKKWMACLPGETRKQDPWLIFFLTMTQRIQGGKKNLRAFQDALAAFEQDGDTRGRLLCIGYLIEAAVFVRQAASRILNWIQKGESLLAELRQDDHFPWARALLWQHIGLGYIAGSGDLPKGISACRNAVLLGQQINTPDLVANASIIMTFGQVQAGDFSNARQMLDRIKQASPVIENPEYRALKRIVDINFALNSGQTELARQLLDESEADIDTFGLIFLYPGFIEAKALHALYTAEFEPAFQLADHLQDFSILEGNNFYEGIAARIRAMGRYLQSGYDEAAGQIALALSALDPLKKGDIHHYQTLQISGFIDCCRGRPGRAEKSLASALDYFNRMSLELNSCQTLLALGYVRWQQGETQAALEDMQQGIKRAARENYRYFPLLKHRWLIQSLLLLSANKALDCPAPYFQALVKTVAVSDFSAQLDAFCSGLNAREKTGAIARLTPVYKAVLPGLYLETLGQFNIHLGSRRVDQKSFEGLKPVMLLKALVLHGGKDIPKEVLIDDLWPKASRSAGEKNFKINLHRLRKAIEPSPKKEFGYSYIIQKSGLISFDSQLVQLDTGRFEQALSQGMQLEKNDQYESALNAYETACHVYKGDYFTEEPYQDWISRKRDLYRTRYLELLVRKARIHEELNQIDKAVETWYLALDTDPCFETAYQNLMILFADTGQKNRAVDIFQTCIQVLKNELGSAPDKQTSALYHQIQSR